MEDTRKSTINIETVAWGALFILWGITEMLKFLPNGTFAIGIGLILVGVNVVRSFTGQPTSGFTATIGILALLVGGLEIARSLFHFSFEIPIFAILMFVLGLILMGGAFTKK